MPPLRGWGARLPYLLGSGGITCATLLALPWVPKMTGARAPVPEEHKGGSPQWATLVVFVLLAVVLDALSSIQEELCRAMVPDLALRHECTCAQRNTMTVQPSESHLALCPACTSRKADIARGHGALSVAAGIGNGLGYALGAVPWNTVFGKEAQEHILSVTCGVGTSVLVVLYVSALLYASGLGLGTVTVRRHLQPPSTPLGTDEGGAACTQKLLLVDRAVTGESLVSSAAGGDTSPTPAPPHAAPSPRCWYHRGCLRCGSSPRSSAAVPLTDAFLWLCLQQLVATAGLWPVWSFASAYFAEGVLGGLPDADAASEAGRRYILGVQLGAAALCGMSAVNSLYAAWLPRLLARQRSPPRTPQGVAPPQDSTAEEADMLLSRPPGAHGRGGASRMYLTGQCVAGAALAAAGVLGLLWRPSQPPPGTTEHGVRFTWVDGARCTVAFLGVASSGLCWAGNNVFAYAALPGTLPVRRGSIAPVPPPPSGLYTSLLYMAQTLPQVFTALAVGPLAQYTPAGFGSAILIAAVSAVVAAAIMQWKLKDAFDSVAVGG